jgi:prolyl-tRNA synthetase
MRWSNFFVPTTKETPKDATAASHVLMLRAGMIRQLAAGMYSYLPLGYRTLRKVERIVREEMDAAGAVELHLPVLQPVSAWHETGRVESMGDVLLRLRPVRDGDEGDWRAQTVLGPTHEEVITEIARAYLKSYKQLPVNLYQIQTKFRGEARPKSGVLRTREFLMKDAYSFDADLAGLDASYRRMYDAYCRIYDRCGLPYVAVEADSGAIGGDASHEFMVLTDAGEDLVAISDDNQYAANVERATCRSAGPASPAEMLAVEEVHTPGMGKVDDVCAFLKTSSAQMIKTLIYEATARRSDEATKGEATKGEADQSRDREGAVTVVALVRGDHDINEIKLGKATGLSLTMAEPRAVETLTGAAVGFAGPQGLVDRFKPGDVLIIDRDVVGLRNTATGANKTDYHVKNVNPGRDFPLDGDNVTVADIRNVVDGDLSESGSPIRLRKAIEVGHVFKLGTKYSEAMGAAYLDGNGKPKPLVMGCYGIGLNRIVAAAIEAGHDDNGIIWSMSIAPFEALVLALDPRDDEAMAVATQIHDDLTTAGVDVLFDDRNERAGFKFKDADLIGVPIRIIVGKRGLTDGVVEVGTRRAQDKTPMKPEDAVQHAIEFVRGARR